MIVSDARAFQSALKIQISDHSSSISIYGLGRCKESQNEAIYFRTNNKWFFLIR